MIKLPKKKALLANKIKPVEISDIIGQANNIKKLRKLFETNSLILIYGVSGSGKTLTVKLLAEEMKLEIIRPENLDSFKIALKNRGLFNNNRLIVQDNGSYKIEPKDVLKRKYPVIIIDEYDNLKHLKKEGKLIKFKRESDELIFKDLKRLTVKYSFDINDKSLLKLIKTARGDIRQIINNLQFWKDKAKTKNSKKDRFLDPVSALEKLFLESSVDKKLDIYFQHSEILPELMFDSCLGTRPKIKLCSELADMFSIGDLFHKRMDQQDYQFMPYYGMMTCVAPGYKLLKSEAKSSGFPESWKHYSKERSNQNTVIGLKRRSVDRLMIDYYPERELVDNMCNLSLEVKEMKKEEKELIKKLKKLRVSG